MTTTPEPGDATPAGSTTPPTPTAPPATPAAPAPTARPPSSGSGLLGSPLAIALCVAGAVLVVVSIFLNWADITIGRQSFSTDSSGIPLEFLWHKNTTSEDPSLIVALIPAAMLIVLGTLRKVRWLALLGGIIAILVAGLYAYQVNSGLDKLPTQVQSIFDFIGIAPWFAFVGGIFGVVGGLVPRRAPRGALD